MRTFLLILAWATTTLELFGSEPTADDNPPVQVKLTEKTALVFASASEGREILGRHDAYIESLAALERQIRLHSDKPVSIEEFVAHVQKQVLPWGEEDHKLLASVASSLSERMKELALPAPEQVLLIQTTGKDESDAAYTRGAAIVLPRKRIELKPNALERLLAHELFHVISRHDAELRKQLYAIIGFQPCNPIVLPDELAKRQITNPDAPTVDFSIDVEHDGEELSVVPILLAEPAEFDSKRKRLFDYLQFRLLVIEPAEDDWKAKLVDGQPLLIDGRTCESYREQIGRNTQYIIHPDEILADNFVHLVMRTKELKSPEIVEKMKEILGEKVKGCQGEKVTR